MRPFTPSPPDDDGFALPELLIAMVIGLVALAAVLFFIASSQQHNEQVFERVGAVDDTSLALKRVQDQLRQAYKITPTPATGTAQSGTLTYQAIVRTGASYGLHSFLLDCTQAGATSGTYKCVKTDQNTGTSEVILADLVAPTASVFTVRAPGTNGLPRVDLTVTHRIVRGGAKVRLTSSVQPRNCQTTPLTAGACPFP